MRVRQSARTHRTGGASRRVSRRASRKGQPGRTGDAPGGAGQQPDEGHRMAGIPEAHLGVMLVPEHEPAHGAAAHLHGQDAEEEAFIASRIRQVRRVCCCAARGNAVRSAYNCGPWPNQPHMRNLPPALV